MADKYRTREELQEAAVGAIEENAQWWKDNPKASGMHAPLAKRLYKIRLEYLAAGYGVEDAAEDDGG